MVSIAKDDLMDHSAIFCSKKDKRRCAKIFPSNIIYKQNLQTFFGLKWCILCRRGNWEVAAGPSHHLTHCQCDGCHCAMVHWLGCDGVALTLQDMWGCLESSLPGNVWLLHPRSFVLLGTITLLHVRNWNCYMDATLAVNFLFLSHKDLWLEGCLLCHLGVVYTNHH